MSKFALIALLALALVGLMLGAAKYSEAVAQREAERVQFEETLKKSKEKLEQTRKAIEKQQAALQKSRTEIASLERTLRRHDLAYLAKAKPCLIAKRMTAATRAAYKKIAETTGASIEELAGPAPKVCKA